jgi:outer membrane protein OmpA-like peptidoglycan-associated protein
VQIKLYDTNGKLIKSLTVPLIDEAGSLQVDLALPVGEFTVQASVISAAGVASDAVAMAAPIVSRPYFTPAVGNNPPVLEGTRVANPIGFDGNSSSLSASARTELRKIARSLKSASGRIAITGFSAQLPGQFPSSKALATKRASAVAKFLKKQGIRIPIFFAGYGGLNDSQAAGLPRKVEIRLIK